MLRSLRSLAVSIPLSASTIAMLVGTATGSAAGAFDLGASADGNASPFYVDIGAYFSSHPELFAKVNPINACPLPPPGPLPPNCHRDCENIFNNGGCPVCTIRCDGSSGYTPCPPVQLPTVGKGCYTKCSDDVNGCPVCVEECYDLGDPPPPPVSCPDVKLWPVGPTCSNKCSRDANGCTTCVEECFQPQQAPAPDPWVNMPAPAPACPEFRKDDLGPGCYYACKTGENGCPDCWAECPAQPAPSCTSEPFAPAPPGCFYNCSTSPDSCPVCNLQCDPWASMPPPPPPSGNCHTGPFDPVAPGCFYDCTDRGNGCFECSVKCG